MTQPDTQQSETTPRDTPPDQIAGEASASTPDVPNAGVAGVDALLDQVQNLTQDIIDDTAPDTTETDVSADRPPDAGDATAATNASTVAEDVAESPFNTDVDEAQQTSASALPPILELEAEGEASDAAESEADYEEAHAILESLQSLGQDPDDALEVDPESQLVTSEDHQDDDTEAAEDEVGAAPSDSGLTEQARAARDESADNSNAFPEDDSELPDLLRDPDGEDTRADQKPLEDSATHEPPAVEELSEEVSAAGATVASSAGQIKKKKTAQARWLRITKITLRRAVSRGRRTVTNPKQLLRGLIAGPKRLFAYFDRLLIWLDRPFAGMSPQRKHVIGIVALATLIAGTLIWVLPLIAYTNPFSDMSRGISSVPQ